MDDSVRHAMARWPDVPAVYGYLGLNRRGAFLLQGHVVTHERTLAFIQRNFGLDERGRAYFQNGPQRAYADLEATPWIYHLRADHTLETHTGAAARQLTGAALTDAGDVILITEHGPGLLDAQDLDALAPHLAADDGALEAGLDRLLAGAAAGVTLTLPAGSQPLRPLAGSGLAAALGFDPAPAPAADEPAAVAGNRPAWVRRATPA